MKPRFGIKKISEIPFRINRDTDKVLIGDLSRSEVDGALDYLGYLDARKKIINGVMVYYKAKRDGVYVSYIGKGE